MYAEADGYDWLWVDTCCIDKTSSAELSEAINSMYDWYSRASACYAFLADVPSGEDPGARDSAFRRSAWFTRCWTLQELIAPQDVVFLSRDWRELGNKYLWPGLLQEITGIEAEVLTFLRPLASIPIAMRMRWAAKRQARRVEDEAYALMGIFGVNMPTIYGEGRRAFRRLQEEIMRQTPDQTLFLWGSSLHPGVCADCTLQKPSHVRDYQGLLADAPSDFASVPDLVPIPYEHMSRAFSSFASQLGIQAPEDGFSASCTSTPLPEFTVTSHGIRARVPVIEPVDITTPQGTVRYALALLACARSARGPCPYLALLLRPHPGNAPVYHVGLAVRHTHGCLSPNEADSPSSPIDIARYTAAEPIVHRTSSRTTTSSATRLRWAELYITSCSSDAPFLPAAPSPALRRRLSSGGGGGGTAGHAGYYVVFPAWLVSRLGRAGFATPDWLPSRPHEGRLLARAHAVFAFSFAHALAPGVERFRIYVGLCPTTEAGWGGHGVWAAVEICSHMGRIEPDMHDRAADCGRAHLLWPMGEQAGALGSGCAAGQGARVEMAFGDKRRKVSLSVGRSDRALGSTNVSVLVIHIELGGSVYAQLEKRMVELRDPTGIPEQRVLTQ
ncbi:hypothetical protein C8Q77DRAFT_1204784 [Trametes polyzona]|nr:hypothetical protein C8Q77DRAFT_1204784 [Trametes polyzona]